MNNIKISQLIDQLIPAEGLGTESEAKRMQLFDEIVLLSKPDLTKSAKLLHYDLAIKAKESNDRNEVESIWKTMDIIKKYYLDSSNKDKLIAAEEITPEILDGLVNKYINLNQVTDIEYRLLCSVIFHLGDSRSDYNLPSDFLTLYYEYGDSTVKYYPYVIAFLTYLMDELLDSANYTEQDQLERNLRKLYSLEYLFRKDSRNTVAAVKKYSSQLPLVTEQELNYIRNRKRVMNELND